MSSTTYETKPSGKICPECGKEIRFIIVPPFGMEIPDPCECQLARERAEYAAGIERGKVKIRAVMRRVAGLRPRWNEYTFSSIRPRQGQERVYKLAQAYSEKFYRLKGEGLILSGSTGCGKTMLAAAIANAVIDITGIDDYEAERVGRGALPRESSPVRMASTVDLMAQIKNCYGSGGAQELIAAYQSAQLAILDDVGAEKPSDWVIERLFEIIDRRYSDRLPIIITTNQTPGEMEKRLGSRIVDRLNEVCVQADIAAPSQRAHR